MRWDEGPGPIVFGIYILKSGDVADTLATHAFDRWFRG